MILTGVSAEVSAEKHEEGADPFAAAIQNMRSDGIPGRRWSRDSSGSDPRPLSSSRYTSQTSAMLWSVGWSSVRHGADSGAGNSTKSSTGRPGIRSDCVTVLDSSRPIQ